MANTMLAKKSLADLQSDVDSSHSLKKSLGALELTALGIGCIIGTGIFVLTGVAAAKHAGPGIMLSFVIAGLACAFAGLCYAEFASMIPIAGSAYTYAYATLGELVAWIIGWDLILEYTVGASAVAIGWSGYLVKIFHGIGVHLPVAVTNPPGLVPGSLINLPAIVIVLIMTWVLVLGVKESARFNNVMVAVKLAVVLLFIVMGTGHINTANWTPLMPFGWTGVLTGASFVFFAYIGFDAVSTTAEEAKNPQRDLPIGIMASLGICTVLYIVVAAIMTGVVPYAKLDVPAPMAEVFSYIGITWAEAAISVGAIAGITSVLLVMLMAQPRVFFSMARDGLLPAMFSRVHPKYQTPHVTTIATGLVVASISGFVPLGTVAEMANIGTLFAFAVVCAGVWRLRHTDPHAHRSFRTPWVPLLPILGILFSVGLMFMLPGITWVRFFVWLGIGSVVYFKYGAKHSKLAEANRVLAAKD